MESLYAVEPDKRDRLLCAEQEGEALIGGFRKSGRA
jgi:hypothetical protein